MRIQKNKEYVVYLIEIDEIVIFKRIDNRVFYYSADFQDLPYTGEYLSNHISGDYDGVSSESLRLGVL